MITPVTITRGAHLQLAGQHCCSHDNNTCAHVCPSLHAATDIVRLGSPVKLLTISSTAAEQLHEAELNSSAATQHLRARAVRIYMVFYGHMRPIWVPYRIPVSVHNMWLYKSNGLKGTTQNLRICWMKVSVCIGWRLTHCLTHSGVGTLLGSLMNACSLSRSMAPASSEASLLNPKKVVADWITSLHMP